MPANKPSLNGTVRVTIPLSVAYDLGKFKKSVAALAARLGCPKCASGLNCTFQLERDYLVDEGLRIQSFAGSRATVPDTAPAVTARLPKGVAGDLRLLNRAIENIAGKLGCHACTSGFDINLRSEINQLKSRNFTAAANGAVG
jgi:hypothetical protein